MDGLFGFGLSTVWIPYLGTINKGGSVMLLTCKKSHATWTDNLELYKKSDLWVLPKLDIDWANDEKVGKKRRFGPKDWSLYKLKNTELKAHQS